MRDQGLDEVFRSTGGASELARRLGISQPSVSSWTRVPASRVAAVGAVTGVPRNRLRPDLYDENHSPSDSDGVDAARAAEYVFLSTLLLRAPDAKLVKRIAGLRADPKAATASAWRRVISFSRSARSPGLSSRAATCLAVSNARVMRSRKAAS